MNVFSEMIAAIAKPHVYPEFLKNKQRKVFGYGMLLVTIFFLLSVAVPYGRFQLNTGGFKQIIREVIPDFNLAGGKLWIERDFMIAEGDVYLEVNTDSQIDNYSYFNDYLDYYYGTVLLIDQEQIIAKSAGETTVINFADMSDIIFTREDIVALVPWLNAIVVISIILIYIFQAIGFFFGVLLLSLAGLIINASIQSNLTYGQIYMMAIYARTTPLLLKGILKLFNIWIPFFWILNAGITIVYLVLACQNIKRLQAEPEKTEQINW